jgi:SRSO17 transposase
MAERLAPGNYDQLHHFVAAGVWDAAPLEKELLVQADKLVGGSDSVLVIDDTAVPKKGKLSSVSLGNMPRRLARTPIARRWYH